MLIIWGHGIRISNIIDCVAFGVGFCGPFHLL
jgi:hypothetical protein